MSQQGPTGAPIVLEHVLLHHAAISQLKASCQAAIDQADQLIDTAERLVSLADAPVVLRAQTERALQLSQKVAAAQAAHEAKQAGKG
mmetsp:Transcript_30896/g.78879  ORF Transcript_30896/g.78879 Transcript_30896/m.78879 type:complete len:87 (-) Transcript_30896:359-619(-)